MGVAMDVPDISVRLLSRPSNESRHWNEYLARMITRLFRLRLVGQRVSAQAGYSQSALDLEKMVNASMQVGRGGGWAGVAAVGAVAAGCGAAATCK